MSIKYVCFWIRFLRCVAKERFYEYRKLYVILTKAGIHGIYPLLPYGSRIKSGMTVYPSFSFNNAFTTPGLALPAVQFARSR
jgi:hypothetical protein